MPEPKKLSEIFDIAPSNAWSPNFLIDIQQQAFQSWTRAIAAWATEMSEFAQARLQENMVTWSALIACRDINQLSACQSQFVQKASADYFAEVNKLSRLAMGEGLTAFRGEPREKTSAPA